MKKFLLVCALLVGVAPAVLADVSVTGVGEVRVEPDQGHVVFTVSVLADSVKTATDRCNAEVRKVITKMRFLKIDDKSIETMHVSVAPKLEYQKDGATKRVGYLAVNQMKICVTDVARTGEVAAATTGSDDCRLDNVYFDLSDDLRSKTMNEARQEAMKDAMRKASLYSGLAKVSLGKMISLSEDSMPVMRQAYRSDAAPMAEGASNIPVSARDMKLRISIHVKFPITPEAPMGAFRPKS